MNDETDNKSEVWPPVGYPGDPGGGAPADASRVGGGKAPKVSVLIATHGRPHILLNCLACLRGQTLPSEDFEILVIDDSSPVPLDEASLQSGRGGPLIKLLRTGQNSGPGIARNHALPIARGALLAITDDDCLPEPRWLEELWLAHQQSPQALLGGQLYNAVPEFICAEASQLISDIVYDWYNADAERSRFFSTNNVAVPREGFEAVGGFNQEFRGASEDRDLCDRWRHSGRTMKFVGGAVVGHAHKLTFWRFVRQHFHYGKGAARFHAVRQRRSGGSVVDEMPFHKALPRLAWGRLRGRSWVRQGQLLFLLGVWQVANAAGYFWKRLLP